MLILSDFDNKYVRKLDFVFGDINYQDDCVRTRFMNNFTINNHFLVPNINGVTRIGGGNQNDTGPDQIFIKEGLPFIENIGDLVTIEEHGYDHMFCFIDINITALELLTTTSVTPRWNVNFLKNQYKLA